MRILITTGIFPPDIGGPATQIEYLATDLVKNGFVVDVLTYGAPPHLTRCGGAPKKLSRHFRLYAVSRRWPSGLRQFMYALKTLYLSRRCDIIYTTDLYSPGYCASRAAKFWRKKFVVRFAGDSAWETARSAGLIDDDIVAFQEKNYGPDIEQRKQKRTKILKSADAVIAVSDFIKSLAIKIGVEAAKVRIVYNAVDFRGEFPKWQRPAVPTLVFSGRLMPWKGVEMLIKIVSRLKEHYSDIKFEILGDGPKMQSLEFKVKSEKLEKNVNFHGRVSEEETHQVFSRSTIFVLNTDYEGMSHAILNAMSVGVPVITTPVGGNPELIKDGENGLLVPYNDQDLWIGAIRKLLDDSVLQEKFSANGKKVLEKFRWNELIQQTIEIFKKLK